MTSAKETPILALKCAIEWMSQDDQTILSVPATGRLILVNESAHFIIAALESGISRQEMLSRLQKAFPDASEDTLSHDLDACLLDLTREELINATEL